MAALLLAGLHATRVCGLSKRVTIAAVVASFLTVVLFCAVVKPDVLGACPAAPRLLHIITGFA